MAEEGAKTRKKPGQKRKGLGGLSPEKKKLLKSLIMQKAAEDLKARQQQEALEKKKIVEARIPKLALEGLGDDQVKKVVETLYKKVSQLEEEKYDLEVKMRKQEFEINELTLKVNDVKGKFVKPVLKKVSKAESKMAKFDKAKLREKLGFNRTQLKSTGQSKFALDEQEGSKDKPDWGQDQLKKAEEKEGEKEEGKEGEEKKEEAAEEEEEEEVEEVEEEEEEEEEDEEEEEEEEE